MDRFILAADGDFRIEDLLTWARPRLRTDPPDLEEAARSLLFRHPGVFHDEERDLYITRGAYFRNALFRIVPTELELEEGVLVIGHRAIPFGPYGVDATDCALLIQGGGEIRRKKVNWSIDQYRQFYTLLGPEIMMQSLLMSDPQNAARLAGEPNPGTRLRLTVFDLRDLYRRHNFKFGDALILKVLQFAPARYELRAETGPEAPGAEDREQRWRRRFNRALSGVFDLLGPSTVVYEQVALACFLAGRELIEDPSGSPLLCLRSSPDLELHALETHSFIWPKERETDTPPSALSYYSVSVGDSDSLEEILQDTGATIPGSVLEAYMRDALFHGRQDLEAVQERAFGTLRTPEFYDDYQRDAFQKYMQRLWKDVRSGYSRTTDHYAGKCRSVLLEATDEYFEILLSLEEDELTDEQEALIRSAIPLLQSTYSFLESLNTPNLGPDSLDRDLFENAQQTAFELRETARQIAEPPGDPSLAIKRHGPKAQAASLAVQLKVILEGVTPPVWRRLLIPSESTLSDLHHAIQIAFAWDDIHDHFFVVGDEEYSDADELDGRDMNEEDECCLADLPSDLQSFSYVYGFGGVWKHTIEIENLEAHDPGFAGPVCLAGNRACPPEDTDPEVYAEISAAYLDADHPRRSSLLQWAGYPFDPEGFDTNAVNRALMDWFADSLTDLDDEEDEDDDFEDDEDEDDEE